MAEHTQTQKKKMKNENEKKVIKGSIISSVGGLFTVIGITSLSMDSSAIIYLSFTILGFILAAYGFFIMLKAQNIVKK